MGALKRVTAIQGNKVALSMQKSAEVIVGMYQWRHRCDNRRTESIGVLSMTGKGGMTAHGRKHCK